MLIGCFSWGDNFRGVHHFRGDPYLNKTTVLFDTLTILTIATFIFLKYEHTITTLLAYINSSIRVKIFLTMGVACLLT